MSLFEKKKKTQTPACACNGACPTSEATAVEKTDACCKEANNGICCIKILGSGCKNCHTLLENTQKAVSNMGLSVDVEYVTDLQKVMEYGVMSMPALVVNEKVVAMGKVYKPDGVEKLLRKLGF